MLQAFPCASVLHLRLATEIQTKGRGPTEPPLTLHLERVCRTSFPLTLSHSLNVQLISVSHSSYFILNQRVCCLGKNAHLRPDSCHVLLMSVRC